MMPGGPRVREREKTKNESKKEKDIPATPVGILFLWRLDSFVERSHELAIAPSTARLWVKLGHLR